MLLFAVNESTESTMIGDPPAASRLAEHFLHQLLLPKPQTHTPSHEERGPRRVDLSVGSGSLGAVEVLGVRADQRQSGDSD